MDLGYFWLGFQMKSLVKTIPRGSPSLSLPSGALSRLEEWAWVVQAGACIPLAHTTWAATPGWLVLNILGVYARAR